MAEILILPDAFIWYVTKRKQLPLPTDVPLEALQALVETVYLEASLEFEEEKARKAAAHPQPAV